jgi:hypothetical protein
MDFAVLVLIVLVGGILLTTAARSAGRTRPDRRQETHGPDGAGHGSWLIGGVDSGAGNGDATDGCVGADAGGGDAGGCDGGGGGGD